MGFKPFKIVKKITKKVIRPILPYALAIAGSIYGGPMGATVGGSLGQVVGGNKRNMLKNAAFGAAKGYGTGLVASSLLGSSGGGLGSMFGAKSASPLSAIGGRNAALQGLQQAGKGGHGLGGFGTFLNSHGLGGATQYLSSTAKGLGALGSVLGGGKGMNGLLMATALGGKIFGKEKNPRKTEEERMFEHQNNFANGTGYMRPKPLQRKVRPINPYEDQFMESNGGYTPLPYFEEANPETEYARGGHVHGYVKGKSSGIADDYRTEVPENTFVMNSMDVSLLGDGNSERGAHMLDELEEKAHREAKAQGAGFFRNYPQSANVKVMLSDGEYPLSPTAVSYLGGTKKVEKLRTNLRKQKGVKKILLPKTKPLEHYLR